jgi:hypothetical protein
MSSDANYGSINHECEICGLITDHKMCSGNIRSCKMQNKITLFNLFECSKCGKKQLIRLCENNLKRNDEIYILLDEILNNN